MEHPIQNSKCILRPISLVTYKTYSLKAGASITSSEPLHRSSSQREKDEEKQSKTKVFLKKMREEN